MIYRCMRCGRQDEERQLHFKHITTHIPTNNHQCFFCYKFLKNIITYRRHIISQHSETQEQEIFFPANNLTNTMENNVVDEQEITETQMSVDNIVATCYSENIQTITTKLIENYIDLWLLRLSEPAETIKTANNHINGILNGLHTFCNLTKSITSNDEVYTKQKNVLDVLFEKIGSYHKRKLILEKQFSLVELKTIPFSRILTPTGFTQNYAAKFSIKEILTNILSIEHITNSLIFSDDYTNSTIINSPFSGTRAKDLQNVRFLKLKS